MRTWPQWRLFPIPLRLIHLQKKIYFFHQSAIKEVDDWAAVRKPLYSGLGDSPHHRFGSFRTRSGVCVCVLVYAIKRYLRRWVRWKAILLGGDSLIRTYRLIQHFPSPYPPPPLSLIPPYYSTLSLDSMSIVIKLIGSHFVAC